MIKEMEERKGFYGHNPCVMMIPAGLLVLLGSVSHVLGRCPHVLWFTGVPFTRDLVFCFFFRICILCIIPLCFMVLVYKYPRVYTHRSQEDFGRWPIDGLVRC